MLLVTTSVCVRTVSKRNKERRGGELRGEEHVFNYLKLKTFCIISVMQVWMTSSAKWRSLFWPASLPLAEDFWKWEAAASWWCLRQWFDFLQEEHLASVWICPLFLLRSSKCTGSVCEASTLHILGGKPPPWCSSSRVNYYWKDGSVAAMVSLFRLQIIFNLIYNNF